MCVQPKLSYVHTCDRIHISQAVVTCTEMQKERFEEEASS